MSPAKSFAGTRIYTVGHSTRTVDELVGMLLAFDIWVLADIRTIPRSRHNPQFDQDALRKALRARGIAYVHLPRLGGLRRSRTGSTGSTDSTNSAWHHAGFRGYADYMQTREFDAGLAELCAMTAKGAVAIMCAEALPWRCHRSLVADALTVREARVEHLMGPGRASAHRLTPFARVDGSRVTYPAAPDEAVRLDARAVPPRGHRARAAAPAGEPGRPLAGWPLPARGWDRAGARTRRGRGSRHGRST